MAYSIGLLQYEVHGYSCDFPPHLESCGAAVFQGQSEEFYWICTLKYAAGSMLKFPFLCLDNTSDMGHKVILNT